MKYLLLLVTMSLLLLSRPSPGSAASLIPAPVSMENSQGNFTLHEGDVITFPENDEKAHWVAEYLVDLFSETHNLHLEKQALTPKIKKSSAINISRCSLVFSSSVEAYELKVDKNGIRLCAKSDAGLFYAAASLWQLLGHESHAISYTQIQDAPHFRWRGMLLDSARHYQSPQFIKKLINVFALHKLNVLHWHLTDDQAWRLEIKQYPRLTQFGAWRVNAGQGPAHDIDSNTGKPRLYGGFYSQETVKELVKYASDRNVTIVPEIEMPGHASAAIASYPFLASTASPPTAIPADWGVYPYIYNVGDDSFRFLENVLDEVMALFPSPFIHVGGDEAVKDEWKASKQAQALMQKLGLKNEDELQGWFVQRIGKYLDQHGRRLIGWDEVLTGGLGSSAAVMSWHGLSGAVTAARSGHDVVITAAPTLYFDGRMNESADQPPGVADNIQPLEKVYKFNPVPQELNSDEQKHLLGIEGAVWTENFRTEAQVARTAFPRELAVAELAWSPQSTLSWQDFLARIPQAQIHLSSLGMEFSDSPFEPILVETENSDNTVSVSLSNQTNFGEFRYTLNGDKPTSSSKLYQQTLTLPIGSSLRVASFVDHTQISRMKTRNYDALSLHTRNSFELKSCFPERYNLAVDDDAPTQGPRAFFIVNYMNPCWIYESADLSQPTSLSASVGQLPFNFQIGDDIHDVHHHQPSTPFGELEVRLDNCLGLRIASIPLESAVNNPAVTILPETSLPILFGKHNLCFSFTQSSLDPYWVIDKVSLVPGTAQSMKK